MFLSISVATLTSQYETVIMGGKHVTRAQKSVQ